MPKQPDLWDGIFVGIVQSLLIAGEKPGPEVLRSAADFADQVLDVCVEKAQERQLGRAPGTQSSEQR